MGHRFSFVAAFASCKLIVVWYFDLDLFGAGRGAACHSTWRHSLRKLMLASFSKCASRNFIWSVVYLRALHFLNFFESSRAISMSVTFAEPPPPNHISNIGLRLFMIVFKAFASSLESLPAFNPSTWFCSSFSVTSGGYSQTLTNTSSFSKPLSSFKTHWRNNASPRNIAIL